MTDSPFEHAAGMLLYLAAALGASAAVCLVVVWWLRRRGLHWSWTAPALAAACPLWAIDRLAAVAVGLAAGVTTVTGARWHRDDLRAGETSPPGREGAAPRTARCAPSVTVVGFAAGASSTSAGWWSGATIAAAPSAFPPVARVAATPWW
jgi:hypothetical protein